MKKFPGLWLIVFVSIVAVAGLGRSGLWFERSAVIPLIDRNDPAYELAFFYLDRRALAMVLGKPNHPLERASAAELKLAREVARARLSQSVYEADLARVERRPDGSVVLTIPAYRRAGAALERHVLEDLLGGTADAALRQRVNGFFHRFGQRDQTLTASLRTGELNGQPATVYDITHQIGSMTLGSHLTPSTLVTYAPFARLFPAPAAGPGVY